MVSIVETKHVLMEVYIFSITQTSWQPGEAYRFLLRVIFLMRNIKYTGLKRKSIVK